LPSTASRRTSSFRPAAAIIRGKKWLGRLFAIARRSGVDGADAQRGDAHVST
jgi:hypothetical protein